MVKEQVDVKILVADIHVDLPAHEGEADTQFQQKALDVVDEPLLQFPLVSVRSEGQEVEGVGILDGLLGQVGVVVSNVGEDPTEEGLGCGTPQC